MAVPLTVDEVLAHEGFLRDIARGLLADANDVDEVVQHALTRGTTAVAGGRTFLASVARNRAIDLRRRAAARQRAEARAAAADGSVPSAADMAEALEARRLVAEAVLGLSADARAAVWLRWYEGLPPREVARRLGVPVVTARSRLRRALEELRGRLQALAPERWRPAVALLSQAPRARPLPRVSPLWPLVAALSLAAVAVGWALWPPAPAPGPDGRTAFDWLRRGRYEVWVQVRGDVGRWTRLRYARPDGAADVDPDGLGHAQRWQREGARGVDRFRFDPASGRWHVRPTSFAVHASGASPPPEFVGDGAVLEAEVDGAHLRLRRVETAPVGGHRDWAIDRRAAGSEVWFEVERVRFHHLP